MSMSLRKLPITGSEVLLEYACDDSDPRLRLSVHSADYEKSAGARLFFSNFTRRCFVRANSKAVSSSHRSFWRSFVGLRSRSTFLARRLFSLSKRSSDSGFRDLL